MKKPAEMSATEMTQTRKKLPLWKALVMSLVAIILFFGLLEGLLALAGVSPALQNEDPFVGFASKVPLFVEETGPDGRKVMVTAENKLTFFNTQRFPKDKAEGTYRIFCLGGSTTYGRPYDDTTSFSGWLRELMPVADPSKKWEVINAGGISYASYRVASLMEELVEYEPDLFIIYTGHNEFLEERTYGALRDIPAPIRTVASLLARTRTWNATSSVLNKLGALPDSEVGKRDVLPGEVNTILARSAGPERYERDDALRDGILLHYRISLERMADIARSAGANIIFVKPASNLKDSSPFKSQHTAGLDTSARMRSEDLLSAATVLVRNEAWSEALETLDEAIESDPRYAELHYLRGKVLFALGRYDEAAEAFRRARDEDVCPLRALTPIGETLEDVSREKGVTLVDFIDLIDHRLLTEHGHSIPGSEYFLDHVHPTIEGNRILAVELIQAMAANGELKLAESWGDASIAEVASRVKGGIDRKKQAQALVNLAKVLNWAGKREDAARLANQALSYEVEHPRVVIDAISILGTQSEQQGNVQKALYYYRKALKMSPGSPIIHLKMGLTFLNEPLRNFEVASAHIMLASVFMADSDIAHLTFGLAMAERHRYALAYSSIMEASRLNPQNKEANSALARLRDILDPDALKAAPPKFSLEKYPSGAPSKVVQVRANATGRYVPSGVWTEWYETGELKRFADFVDGVQHGVDITWDEEGRIISRAEYQHGTMKKSSERSLPGGK